MHEVSDWRDTMYLQILEEALDKEMKEVVFNIIPLLDKEDLFPLL